MRNTGAQLVVAALVVVVIGVLTDKGWAGYLIGAINALTLWFIVFFGSLARDGKATGPSVPATTYAGAAVVALLIGYLLFAAVGDGDNGVWWSVGVIMAGVMAPYAAPQRSGRG